MAEIIPAILEKKFDEIKNKLAILAGRVETVHLDFCDGTLTPSQTWPFSSSSADDAQFREIINAEEGLPHWQEFDFELDLMTSDAVENFDLYLKLGPKRIILHPDWREDTTRFREFLEGQDMYLRDHVEIGLACKPGDDRSLVLKLSHLADFLHCLGSDRIGFQGEAFSPGALQNIEFFKKTLPGVVISVDIGINLQNTESILKAGVDRLIVGSAIWKSGDPLGALQAFQSLV